MIVGRTLAHYRIVAKAGSGSMGEVYRAEDEKLKRTVALKLLPENLATDPQRLARFQQEAEVLARLEHPNIVTIFSIDDVDQLHFLTMTWVDGETLEESLRRQGFLLNGVLDIAIPLARAVAAAHSQGIVHRDLKPANVMIDSKGRLKVLDFGLARSGGISPALDSAASTLSHEGMLIGSLPYMAPEQVRGETADARSDVFALGSILHELATGERPFQGSSAADLISAILRDSPPPVDQVRPELPRQLGRIIHTCLHKDPDRRYESALGLRNALEDLRTESGRLRPDFHSIAVLPFVDMSPERDQGHFCEGIAEEILNALSALESLHVAARASSFQFREGALDVREIGQRLGVKAILDGSVRKAGNRLRITAQLIHVADGYHLWSDRFDRELEDVFAIQDEIAESVVQALQLTLSPIEKESIKQPRATHLEAYDYYLRGRRLSEKLQRKDLEDALEMYRKAIEIDPDYAPAWAGIADSHTWLLAWFGHCDDDLEEADRASARAVELAPNSAETRTSRGHLLSIRGGQDAAAEFERALEINPSYFDAFWLYGRHEFRHGRLAEAATLLEKAVAVRPEDYQAALLLPQIYRKLGRTDRAVASAQRGVERARQRLELNPRDTRALYLSAAPLFMLGEKTEAYAVAAQAVALGPDEPATLYNVACFYSLAGDIERALDCLERVHALDFGYRSWVENDPDLDNLRSHPRFERLLRDTT